MPRPPTRIATAVLLTRGETPEVFCVLRSPELRFFGGYWAFPGGTLDADDASPDDPTQDEERALARCCLRELFEETGVLPAALQGLLAGAARHRLREALVAGESGAGARFRALLDAAPAAFDGLRSLGTLTTPAFAPVRYRTRFFQFHLSDAAHPDVWPDAWPDVWHGELVDGRFAPPSEWLALWRAGEAQVAPPVLFLLTELQRAGLAGFLAELPREFAALEAGRMHTIRTSPGIVMAPLTTPTLPPATTTNAYVVGEGALYVVDPAPTDPAELARLSDLLDARVARGERVAAVLLTHHHPDHAGGAAVIAARYGVPVLAHAETLARLDLPSGVETRALGDGDELELGVAPDGTPGWTLRALHTPGHAPGHLCFMESRYRALIAGDLVSTVSTIVIDPADDGHLATYLASLARIRALGVGNLHPAHGPVTPRGNVTLDQYLQHRATRERMLVGALTDAPRALDALVADVYADVTDPRLVPIAARSLAAGLVKLVEERRAREVAGGWVRAAPAT